MFFILGPALAALLASTPWPGTGLVVAVAAMAIGTVAFASSRVVRTQEMAPRPPSLGLLGALARPGMRTVALAALGCSLVVGSVEVGVPAVTTAAGSPVLAGVLLSAWSATSVLAGVLYSMRPWPGPLYLRVPVLLAAFAMLVAALALAAIGTFDGVVDRRSGAHTERGWLSLDVEWNRSDHGIHSIARQGRTTKAHGGADRCPTDRSPPSRC